MEKPGFSFDFGIGDLIGGVFQWYGMQKQAEENKKTREQNRALFEQQMGFEKEKWGVESALAERQMALGERQFGVQTALTKEQMKRDEQDKMFDRKAKTIGGILTLLNSNRASRASLMGNLSKQ